MTSIVHAYARGMKVGVVVIWMMVSMLSKFAFIVLSVMWPIIASLVYLPSDATLAEGAPFLALQVVWPIAVWFPVAWVVHEYGYSKYFMLVDPDE